jgi:hypothetical protein
MPRRKLPVVISYYTDNWEYPARAEQLRQDCETFSLKHDIVELEDQGSWIDNTRLKSRFVYDKLEEHKRPVLWIDADSRILRSPLGISLHADFAAVRAQSPSKKTWYVGTLLFNYTDAGREIARRWAESSVKGSDHMAFEDLWFDGFPGIIHSLPLTYCDTSPEDSDDLSDIVILTGNSKDESKRDYFRRNGTPYRQKKKKPRRRE